MRTLLIAGDKACNEFLGMLRQGFLMEFDIHIVAVLNLEDRDIPAEIDTAASHKKFDNLDSATLVPGIELIINLSESPEIIGNLKLKNVNLLIDSKIIDILFKKFKKENELKRHIQELAEMENDLENEKKFLQSLFDNMIDMVIVVNSDLTILKANMGFYAFTKTKPEESIGNKCHNILSKTDLCNSIQNFEEIFGLVAERKMPQTRIIITKVPRESHWEMTITPIFNKDGNIQFYLIIWHRITEKIMLKREIEMAEERFKSFINSAKDWISMKDPNGCYMVVSPTTANAFDLTPNDFIGKKPDDLLNPEIVKIIKEHDRIVIESGSAQTFNEILRIKGKDIHFQMVRFPLYDWKGDMIGTCTIGRDVTNEILLQQQLFQSEKLAALGKLAAGVAHEINNPLMGILANAEYIVDNLPDNNELLNDIKIIINEALRCRDIVKLLLDFSRQDTPNLQECNLKNIINNCINLVSRLPNFKEIEINLNPDDIDKKIIADSKQIEQVMLNLLINAAEAMKNKGKIFLAANINDKENLCVIEVDDTGPGVPNDFKEQIFEPFFSTKNTNGLGLAVSRGIIERHNGSMTVENNRFGGAKFIVTVPSAN